MEKIRNDKLTLRDKKIGDFIQKYEKDYREIDQILKEKILNSKALDIYTDICENKIYTSTTVILVYCFASITANERTNSLTEIMFDEAIRMARSLDESFQQSNNPKGPLHGIPFSIKDTFDIENIGKIRPLKRIKLNFM
jgi:hypothetical protein